MEIKENVFEEFRNAIGLKDPNSKLGDSYARGKIRTVELQLDETVKHHISENSNNDQPSNWVKDKSDKSKAAESPEHVSFGDRALNECLSDESEVDFNYHVIALLREHKLCNIRGDRYFFTLENGAQLTLGHIVALAGDFFGLPDYPICLGETDEQKKTRFISAYHTLVQGDERNVAEIKALISAIEKQSQAVEDNAKKDSVKNNYANAYKEMASYFNKEYSDITAFEDLTILNKVCSLVRNILLKGGVDIPNIRSRYFQLLQTNFDHFVPHAHNVYAIGHSLALDAAKLAKKYFDDSDYQSIRKCDVNSYKAARYLVLALTLEAFAAHYSTDAFTSGHIRVPRKELHEVCYDAALGDALSHWAQDTDDRLWVSDKNEKKKWETCGDGHFFEDEFEEAKIAATRIVKLGLMNIYYEFRGYDLEDRDAPLTDAKWYENEWPVPCESGVPSPQNTHKINHYPLFRWMEKNEEITMYSRDDEIGEACNLNFEGLKAGIEELKNLKK